MKLVKIIVIEWLCCSKSTLVSFEVFEYLYKFNRVLVELTSDTNTNMLYLRKNYNFTSTLREKGPNAGKYGLEKTPYSGTFHAVAG